jgi:hypothetical protein
MTDSTEKVCFVHDVERNLVKIGASSQCPHVYIAGLAQTRHQRGKFPDGFRLLGVMACDYKFDLKKELHARFANCHKGNDWFDPVPELRIFISAETRGHACNECMNPSAAEDEAARERVDAAVAEAFRKIPG